MRFAIAIDLIRYPIAFETGKGMPTYHPFLGKELILGFLIIGELSSLGLFMRNLNEPWIIYEKRILPALQDGKIATFRLTAG